MPVAQIHIISFTLNFLAEIYKIKLEPWYTFIDSLFRSSWVENQKREIT